MALEESSDVVCNKYKSILKFVICATVLLSLKSPYRSGFSIDYIPEEDYNKITQKRLVTQLQTIMGLLNWLSVSTCPNIAIVTSLITKYCQSPSEGIYTQPSVLSAI